MPTPHNLRIVPNPCAEPPNPSAETLHDKPLPTGTSGVSEEVARLAEENKVLKKDLANLRTEMREVMAKLEPAEAQIRRTTKHPRWKELTERERECVLQHLANFPNRDLSSLVEEYIENRWSMEGWEMGDDR